jgi:hypothetical protein
MPHVPEVTVQSFYTFIALDLARDRAREAEQHRLLKGDFDPAETNGRSIRRRAGSALEGLGRAIERLARRIDDNVDDALVSTGLLGRSRS